MRKDDYIGWRNHPVTQEYLENVVAEMDAVIGDLVNTAGDNSGVDKYRRGVLAGMRFVAEWQPRFFDTDEEEEDGDASSGSSGTY